MPKNHEIRKHFNEVLYNIARYAEIVFSIIILIAIASQVIPLINEVTQLPTAFLDLGAFNDFLAESLSLIVGLEFVRMLSRHTAETLVEVLLVSSARQMVVEHLSTGQTLIGVVAIGLLFAIRKYLLIRTDEKTPDNLHSEKPDKFSK